MKDDHITIRRSTDGVEVVADDLELHDYLDDLFADVGLEPDYVREELRDGKRMHVLHFGTNVPEVRIHEVLDAISEEEIERIWRLNN